MTAQLPGREPPGLWLRQRRVSAQLTQEELAERAGLSTRAVSALERDHTSRPYSRTIRLVGEALGLTQAECDELIAWYRGSARDDAPPTAAPGRPRTVPRELPMAVPHFVGRAAELAMLDGWLRALPDPGSGGAAAVVVISGMAGVGKTTLALHWAHRSAARFPDGQLYVNLHGHSPDGPPTETAEVIRRFLDALGVPPEGMPTGPGAQAALYRSLLAGRRMLIVADNAATDGQVRALIPGAPGCLVLVTARNRLTGLATADGAHLLTLNVFSEAEAAGLLTARLGAGRIAAEPAAATELIRLSARLPLAVAIVAARAAGTHWPLATVSERLAGTGGRLAALDAGEATADVRTVFSWSYRQLSEAAAGLFRALGMHPGPDISGPAAVSLSGLPPPEAQAALRELTGASLLTEPVPGRYTQHDLLREYAIEEAGTRDSEWRRHAVHRRLLDHYLYTADAAARALDPAEEAITEGPPGAGVVPEPIAGRDQALAWFIAEHKVLLGVLALAPAAGFGDHAWQLPWAVGTFLDWAGHWRDLASTQQIALAASVRLGDLEGQARAHRSLGKAWIRLGDAGVTRSHLTQAMALSRQLGDQAAEARAQITLSSLEAGEGQLRDALAGSLRALDLAQAAGHPMMRAMACNNAGYIYALLGEFQQGLSYCRRALELPADVGDGTTLRATTWDSIAYIYHQMGSYPQAIRSYRRAIGMFTELGARYLAAVSTAQLGDSQLATGDTEAARQAWQQALAILTDLEHPGAGEVEAKLRGLTAQPGRQHRR